MTVQTVFSTNPAPKWPDELERLYQMPRREPFDAGAVAFVGAISSRILRSDLARTYPELAALAHWFRPASVRDMARRAQSTDGRTRVRPRGLVFALAPANVDVLFIYGWFLSLLTGNASVVRVSRQDSPVREAFMALVAELVEDPGHAETLNDSWIITYDHSPAISGAISKRCNARLIWGGDATVAQIRALPVNPLAIDVAFADRFSLAAFDANAVCALGDDELADFARKFANDTLWFAQQACSSPRAVWWIGDEDVISTASQRFWPVYRESARIFEDEPAAVMSRTTDLFALAATGAVSELTSTLSEVPARGKGGGAFDDARFHHSGYGLFVEYSVRTAPQIAGHLSEKDQTMVAFGISTSDCDALVEALPNRALDRIVAPGEATEFATVWDGTDLFDVLTRRITVPKSAPARV